MGGSAATAIAFGDFSPATMLAAIAKPRSGGRSDSRWAELDKLPDTLLDAAMHVNEDLYVMFLGALCFLNATMISHNKVRGRLFLAS